MAFTHATRVRVPVWESFRLPSPLHHLFAIWLPPKARCGAHLSPLGPHTVHGPLACNPRQRYRIDDPRVEPRRRRHAYVARCAERDHELGAAKPGSFHGSSGSLRRGGWAAVVADAIGTANGLAGLIEPRPRGYHRNGAVVGVRWAAVAGRRREMFGWHVRVCWA